MSVRKHDYNAIDWHSLVYYDETSPSGLRWKVTRNNFVKAGRVGGRPLCNPSGGNYWRISIYRKTYYVHNVVMILHHGKLDDASIVDHIDGDGSNNLITNLRAIPYMHNMHNMKTNKLNKSGVPGVHYDAFHNRWVGCVGCGNKKIRKAFSCKIHHDARQLAIDFVTSKRLELNASGEAAFTDRHIGIDTSINSSSKQENTLDACFQQD